MFKKNTYTHSNTVKLNYFEICLFLIPIQIFMNYAGCTNTILFRNILSTFQKTIYEKDGKAYLF